MIISCCKEGDTSGQSETSSITSEHRYDFFHLVSETRNFIIQNRDIGRDLCCAVGTQGHRVGAGIEIQTGVQNQIRSRIETIDGVVESIIVFIVITAEHFLAGIVTIRLFDPISI